MKKLIASLGGIFFLLILVGAGCSSTTPAEEVMEEEAVADVTASVTIEDTGADETPVEVEVEVVE